MPYGISGKTNRSMKQNRKFINGPKYLHMGDIFKSFKHNSMEKVKPFNKLCWNS